MSYARFSEGDVYVFATNHDLECCGCLLQKSRWVESDGPFGGYMEPVEPIIETRFTSNDAMLAHLEAHIAAGHDVPERALARLRDPLDAARNLERWSQP